MNQHISFHRLQLLFRVFLAERGKAYLGSLSLIVTISTILMVPILFKDGYHDILYVIHSTAFFGPVLFGGSLFSSTVFSHLHQQNQGIASMMLPASRLEKFLIILVTQVLFITFIIYFFWLMHHTITDAANAVIPEGKGYRRYNQIPPDVMRYFVFLYFLIQGIVFLCSIYFSRNVFIKSLIVTIGVGLAAILLHLGLAYQMTGATSQINSLPFMPWTVYFNGRANTIFYPENIQTSIRILLALIVVALMLTAYVRLREKEI